MNATARIQTVAGDLVSAYRARYRKHPEQMIGLITGTPFWRSDISLPELDSLWESCRALRDMATDPIHLAQLTAAYFELRDIITVKEVEAEYRANRFAGWEAA